MMETPSLLELIRSRYGDVRIEETKGKITLRSPSDRIPEIAVMLTTELGGEFATLVVEDTGSDRFMARYFFYLGPAQVESTRGIVLELLTETENGELPSISDQVHAADWYEREAEDMFGIQIAGHPFLGDFVLHDADFPEAVGPMRHRFDARSSNVGPGLGTEWKPRRILEEDGALIFPVGPVWGDYHEAGLWLLETPGEQIRQAHSRLFYKYRAVEKIAEGSDPEKGLLLAERFSGNAAFAHALAYCQAIEKIADCEVPHRAQQLRLVFAELERIRYHAATIAELAGSTGLAVGKAMAQEIEESLLRLTCEVCGHRYLFGLMAPGGLAFEPDPQILDGLDSGVTSIRARLDSLERLLVSSSSFLDRIEEMGVLTPALADVYGVVGPVARASGRQLDLRCRLPYGAYEGTSFDPPREIEGDGYARMRVFFAEIRTSTRLVHEQLQDLAGGPSRSDCRFGAGEALGWTEAPTGGAFHFLQTDENGSIRRWRISTAGFRNWHAFHRAVEGAAFQDFPIILASFGLSIAENDR